MIPAAESPGSVADSLLGLAIAFLFGAWLHSCESVLRTFNACVIRLNQLIDKHECNTNSSKFTILMFSRCNSTVRVFLLLDLEVAHEMGHTWIQMEQS